MGFDSNCVINVESLKGECLCPICGNLVYPNEAMQTPCGHLYCKPCLAYVEQNTKICPQDGMFVTASEAKHLVQLDGALAIAIWHTSVRCIHHMSGCLWQGTLFDSMSHTYECAYSYSQAMDAQQYQLQPEQYMQYYQSHPPMQQQQQQQQKQQLPCSDPNAQHQYTGQQSIPLQAQQFPYQAMQPQFIPPQYTTFTGSPQLPNSLNKPYGSVPRPNSVSGSVTGMPQRQHFPLQAPQRLNLGNKKEVSLQVPNLHQTPHDGRRMKKERDNLVTSYAINCGNRHGSSSQCKRPSSSIKIEPFSPPPSSSQFKGASTVKIEPVSVDDASSPCREQRAIKADSFPLSPVSSEQFNWTWTDDDDFIPFSDFEQSSNVDAGQAQNIAGDFEGFIGDDIKEESMGFSLPANTKMIHGDIADNFGGKASNPNSIQPQQQFRQVDIPAFDSGGSSQQLVHGTGIHPGDMEASNPNSKKRQRKGIICAICSVVVEDLETHSQTKQHHDALSAFIMSNKQNSWKKQRFGR